MSQPSQQQQTREMEVLTTRALVEPSSFNAEARTVEVTWATGAEVTRRDWSTGERYSEALSMDPKAIRLDRLNAGAPVLDSHNASSTRSVLASVVPDTAKSDGKRGSATIKFSRRPEAEVVMQDVRDGVLRNLSVGYLVHRYDVVKASDKALEKRTAVDWEPYEISIVPIPADAAAQVRAHETNQPERAQKKGKTTMTIANNESVTAERARVTEIDSLCSVHGIDNATRSAWLAEGAEIADVREAILASIASRQSETRISPVSVGNARRDVDLVRDASDALARRADVRVEGEGHRNFGDAGLIEIAKRVLECGGVNTRSLSKHEIATRALGTGDFATIMAVAGQKTVRAAYSAIPLVHREVFRKAYAKDFKAKHSILTSAGSLLPEIPEGGIIPRQSASAEMASYAVKTYASIIPITRQLLINDDFNLVAEAARQRARSAAETERNLVWSYILQASGAGPTAPDGLACFHTDHGNFPTAVVAANTIDIDKLSAARSALRSAESPDGFAINATLAHIVTGVDGETAFDKLLNGVYLPEDSNTAMTATLRGKLKLHVEPMVPGTSWYGFCDYGMVDTFEYAYLEGTDGPRVEQRLGFDIEGIELKVALDFGVGLIDWRGTYYQRQT